MAKQADTDGPYAPPLTLTPALLSEVAAITASAPPTRPWRAGIQPIAPISSRPTGS
jgi:hypothetical protein